MARKLGDPDPCGCGLVHRAPGDPGPDGKYDFAEAVRVEPAYRMRVRHWDPEWKVKRIRTRYSDLCPAGIAPQRLSKDGVIAALRAGPRDIPVVDERARTVHRYDCIDELAYLRKPLPPSRKPLPAGRAPLPGASGTLPWQGVSPPVSPPGSKGPAGLGLHGNQPSNPQAPGVPTDSHYVPPGGGTAPVRGVESMDEICGDLGVLGDTPFPRITVDFADLQAHGSGVTGFGANAARDAVRDAYRSLWRAWSVLSRWATDTADHVGLQHRWDQKDTPRELAPRAWFGKCTQSTLIVCRDTYRALLDVMEGKVAAGGPLTIDRDPTSQTYSPCASASPAEAWKPPFDLTAPEQGLVVFSAGDKVWLCRGWYKKDAEARGVDILRAVLAVAARRGLVPWSAPLVPGPKLESLEGLLSVIDQGHAPGSHTWWLSYLGWAFARRTDGRCTWRPACGDNAPPRIPGMLAASIAPNIYRSGNAQVDVPLASAVNALYTAERAVRHIVDLPPGPSRQRAWDWFLYPMPAGVPLSVLGTPPTALRDWLGEGWMLPDVPGAPRPGDNPPPQNPVVLSDLYRRVTRDTLRPATGTSFPPPYGVIEASTLTNASLGIAVDRAKRRIYHSPAWSALPFEQKVYTAMSQFLRANGGTDYTFKHNYLEDWQVMPFVGAASDLYRNPWPHARWAFLRQKYRGGCVGPAQEDSRPPSCWQPQWPYDRDKGVAIATCTKSNLDRVRRAIKFAFYYVERAWRFLARLTRLSEEDRRNVWHGFLLAEPACRENLLPNTDLDRACFYGRFARWAPARYFGNYTYARFEAVYAIVARALRRYIQGVRLPNLGGSPTEVVITCHPLVGKNSSTYAIHYPLGHIGLRAPWFAGGDDWDRARKLAHEMMHGLVCDTYDGFNALKGLPYDVRIDGEKAYGAVDARRLVQTAVNSSGWPPIRNIDNYRSWIFEGLEYLNQRDFESGYGPAPLWADQPDLVALPCWPVGPANLGTQWASVLRCYEPCERPGLSAELVVDWGANSELTRTRRPRAAYVYDPGTTAVSGQGSWKWNYQVSDPVPGANVMPSASAYSGNPCVDLW